MTHRTLILGSRGSQLALRQSELVREALLSAHPDLQIEIKGDKLQHLALDASGDKGLFTGELEASLRRGEIDLAVHSLKDLPVDPAEGTCLAAYLPRAVTHDTLIGTCPLESLPEGAVVGTSSKRRAYQPFTIHTYVPSPSEVMWRPVSGRSTLDSSTPRSSPKPGSLA